MTPVDLPYVPILLNKTFITALCDTGAEKSFISEEVYRKYFSYRPRQKTKDRVVTAQGAPCCHLGRVDLQIRIREFQKKWEFHIVNNMQYQCILGIDFMKEYKLTLDFAQKSLIILDDQIKQLPKVEKPVEIDLSDKKLGEGQKQKLKDLFNGFKGLFSDQPGLTHVLYHEIDTGDKGPVVSRPYRYDRVKQGIIDYHIKKMLQEGTIRPIQSPYASPVVLTRKNNGLPPDSPEAYRFAIDYRRLNAITKYPRYPLPVIDDLITNIPHTEAPVLQLSNFKEQFNLFTDASGVGIGADLNQNHRPIAFASITLNKAERNYTVTEREFLAVIGALNKFKTYFGSLPVKESSMQIWMDHKFRALALNSKEQLIREQREDPELGHIYRYLENPDDGSVNATICEGWSQDFKLIDGLLFYAKYSTTFGELRVYIPRSLREAIMQEFHDLPLAEGAEYVGRNIEKLFVEARQNMRNQHKTWGKFYNRKRREVNIKVNDLVLVQTHFMSAAGRRVVGKFMPKFAGPYRVLEVRNNNLIIWKNGKRVTVNINQVRVYHPRQSDTISSDSHVETLYDGQTFSNGSSRSHPGKSKGSGKTSSEESKGRKSNKGNAGWEDPRIKRKVGSNGSVDKTDKKRSKICRKRSLQWSEHRDQKRPTPEPTQGIKRTIPSSVSSRKYKYRGPNNPSQGSQSIASPSHQRDTRQCKLPTEGSRQGVSVQYDRAGRPGQLRAEETVQLRGNQSGLDKRQQVTTKGRAQDWCEVLSYTLVQCEETDFDQLKQGLKESFPVVRNKAELEARFSASYQTGHEALVDFVYELLKFQKALKLEMTELNLIQHIVSRLEPQVQDFVEV
ncbi:retrovirus-related Pol polyprotein from transposon 297 [Trichonephila clavipes]|nr:retrovirus-related Pol polyprotein from transposon 297 [Trichonephila clavipes]